MNDVSKSIKWADRSWNPITGCKNNCNYCYARRIATRFKGTKAFPNGFEPTFHRGRLNEPRLLRRPSKIFVCSMGEMFGPWVKEDWLEEIFHIPFECSQHTFQVLTKYPQNIMKTVFGCLLPRNLWMGITITGKESKEKQRRMLLDLESCHCITKFISFEPLLGEYKLANFRGIDWIILGGQTGPKKFYPPEEWIQKIEYKAWELRIPIFEKNNLRKCWLRLPREEFPTNKTRMQQYRKTW